MIYFSISFFCTSFPIVFVLLLFILTWKWLYGADIVSRPPARFSSKAKRSRHLRTTESKIITDCYGGAPDTVDAPLQLPDENKKLVSYGVVFAVERKLQRPCLVCRVQEAKRNCRYERCAKCCRVDKESVCRAHGTGYESAIAQIELALTHHLFCVDISYAQIQQCPPKMIKLGDIPQSLNLSNNLLVELPSKMGNLCALVELFLQYNHLKSLPDSLCNISSLEELDVKNNKLVSLPDQIGQLHNLAVLTLTNNQLGQIPSSIGDLMSLEELSLYSNNLTELPDELCRLKNLQVLYVGENKLKCLPDNIGELSSLSEFDAASCQLTVLPESLSCCTALTKLWVSRNRLTRLPARIGNLKELKELHLRTNQLRYYPFSIMELDVYTINALYNPLLDDLDSKTIQKLTRTPSEPVPPLVELSGRAIIKHRLRWKPGDLPKRLEAMLHSREYCTSCGGAVFSHYWSKVTFGCVGIFRVPLHLITCSLQCQL